MLSDPARQSLHMDAMLGFAPSAILPGGFAATLEGSGPSAGARVSVSGGGGRDRLAIRFSTGEQLDVELESLKTANAHFFDGVGDFTDADGVFHGRQLSYARPRMLLYGFFERSGARRPIVGDGWFERQYGTTLSDVSWVWYAVRLDDGQELHMWDMRSALEANAGAPILRVVNALGAPPACESRTITEFSYETFGAIPALPPEAPEHWPSRHRLVIPELELDLDLLPVHQNQVLVNPLTQFATAWEGLADVTGTRAGQPVTGVAYVGVTDRCCN